MSVLVQDELTAIVDQLWNRTVKIVEENAKAIVGLAGALTRKV